MSYSVIAKTNNTYTPETPYLANTSDVYIPNPQWWDVYNILKNHDDLDVNGGAWKYAYIVLIDDSIPSIDFTLNNSTTSDCQMVTTSDEATYTTTNTTNTTINHVWNDTDAPVCIEGSSTYKTRYYIYWSNKTNNEYGFNLRYYYINGVSTPGLIGIVIHKAKFITPFGSGSTTRSSVRFLRLLNGANYDRRYVDSSSASLFSGCYQLEYCDEIDMSWCTIQYFATWETIYTGRKQLIKFIGKNLSATSSSIGTLMGRDPIATIIFSDNTTTYLNSTFSGATFIEELSGDFDLPNCLGYNSTFNSCYKIKKFPNFVNADNGTIHSGMFYSCYSMKSLPSGITTYKSLSMSNMFNMCFSLLKVSSSYSSGVCLNYENTFLHCRSLEEIEYVDFTSATNVVNMFNSCYRLQIITVKPNTLKISLSFNASSLLTKTSIISILNGLDLTTPATMQTLTFHSVTKALINSDSELSALRDTVVASGKWQIA